MSFPVANIPIQILQSIFYLFRNCALVTISSNKVFKMLEINIVSGKINIWSKNKPLHHSYVQMILRRNAQGLVAFTEITCLEVWRNARKPQLLTFVK